MPCANTLSPCSPDILTQVPRTIAPFPPPTALRPPPSDPRPVRCLVRLLVRRSLLGLRSLVEVGGVGGSLGEGEGLILPLRIRSAIG
jgi:hypothetical protein